jgi:hypothetical protein
MAQLVTTEQCQVGARPVWDDAGIRLSNLVWRPVWRGITLSSANCGFLSSLRGWPRAPKSSGQRTSEQDSWSSFSPAREATADRPDTSSKLDELIVFGTLWNLNPPGDIAAARLAQWDWSLL